MKNLLVKIGESSPLKKDGDLLDLSVIPGMQHGNKTGEVISRGTEEQRILAGLQFNEWVRERGLNLQDIAPETINQFLHSHNWKPNTRNIKREHLIRIIKAQSDSAQFKFFVSEQAKKIEKVKVSKAITEDEFLTREEINHLIDTTKKNKTKLMIEFLFETGCRIEEMINILLRDIALNGQTKVNIIGKGKKEREVYCKRELYLQILNTFGSTGKNDFLFTTTGRNQSGKKVKYNRVNIFRIIQLAGKKAGFKIHPHTLRHSCAMHLKASGKSAQYIQKYLGHSDVVTTIKHYFHDQPGSEVVDCF